jgi:ABC-type lipoprotein export system ATPase subunit
MMEQPILRAESISRRRGESYIVRNVSLSLSAGESAALVGTSGSGKTTLLHLLGVLDRPTEGRVFVDGRDPWTERATERSWLRLVRLGFVFQQSNLLPQLTVRENVALPAWRLHGSRGESLQLADSLLERLGLRHRASAAGASLSLGEAQRVAVARALVNRPAVILADEPTGSLDSVSSNAVMEALEEISRDGTALLVATHDLEVAGRLQRIFRIADGRLLGEN